MTIIERIIFLMDKNNLRSKDLAKYLNVTESVVSSWKCRKNNPKAEYIYKIALFLNVSTDYLLTGNDNTNTSYLTEEQIELLNKYNLLTEKNKGKVEMFIDQKLDEQLKYV